MNFETLKTAKTANPQSPAECAVSQQHSLLSPLRVTAQQQEPPLGLPLRLSHLCGSTERAARTHATASRRSAHFPFRSPLPCVSASCSRALTAVPSAADRRSRGGPGSTLYVWRGGAARVHPAGVTAAFRGGDGAARVRDPAWRRRGGRGPAPLLLGVAGVVPSDPLPPREALSEPPRLASPPPVYDLAVPLPANSTALFLRATPGTVAPPAFAPAAAILATSASQLFAVSLESSVGAPSAAKPGLALSLSPLERSSGSLSRVITAVSSYFSSSQRAGPTAPLAALSLASDWMVTLSSAGATDTAAETIVDCWKRNGTGQSYTHAGGSPLLPLLQPALAHAGRGDAAFLAGRCHVADACVLPAEQPGADGRLLLLLATRGAAGGAAAGATYDLGLVEMSIAPSGALRLAAGSADALAASAPMCRLPIPHGSSPADEDAQLASLSLVTASRPVGSSGRAAPVGCARPRRARPGGLRRGRGLCAARQGW